MYIQDIVKVISLLQINDFSCFSTNDFQSFRENSSLKLYNRFSSLNIFYSAESCLLPRSGELFLVHHISIQREVYLDVSFIFIQHLSFRIPSMQRSIYHNEGRFSIYNVYGLKKIYKGKTIIIWMIMKRYITFCHDKSIDYL